MKSHSPVLGDLLGPVELLPDHQIGPSEQLDVVLRRSWVSVLEDTRHHACHVLINVWTAS